MKRFPVGRLFGIGVGVGLASLAIYQHNSKSETGSIPDSFQVNVSEFRSLAELENSKVSVFPKTNSESTTLVGFDANDDDDNQIALTATEPDDLLLAPELMDEGTVFNEMPTAQESATSVVDLVQPQAPQEAKQSTPAAQSAPSPKSGFSAAKNSAWKANPFINESTAPGKPAIAVSKPVPTGAAELNSIMEFTNEQSVNSSESPTDLAAELQAIKDSMSAKEATKTPTLALMGEANGNGVASAETAIRSSVTEQAPLQQITQIGSSSQRMNDSIAPVAMGLSQSVAQRAAHHIEYGKALARRGASSAARQEFYGALTTLAQANDAKAGANHFSMALRKGIMAIKESEDFVTRDAEHQIALDVGVVIETHRCGAMTMEEAQYMAPVQAMQRYFAFAQHQLNVASGQNVVAAEALFCLGKLHTSVVQSDPTSSRLDVAKAIVFHRTAMDCDRNNYRSANELGVLMARSGQLTEARDMLKKSLIISPGPEAWSNLAKVHERLGEQNMAALARSEFQRVLNSQPGAGIQWVSNQSFNANAPVDFHETIAARPNVVVESPAVEAQETPKSIGQRWKDMIKIR